MPSPRLLFVCTGNATRSVIAASLVRRDRPEWDIDSAGTWAIPGLPSSRRTLAALESVGVSAPGHRSTTLTRDHLKDVDLVVGFERDHVRFIRHMAPDVADRTATLPRLLLPDWPGGSAKPPLSGWPGGSAKPPLSGWPGADLASEDPRTWAEVDDPAGGEIDDFIHCARTIDTQVAQLIARLDAMTS